MSLTQKQKAMQNTEESLYNLLAAKAFNELTIEERDFVLCYLTETEYRNHKTVLETLDYKITSNLIEPDLNIKEVLDKKMSTLKNSTKKAFTFYQIAASLAIFVLFTFVYIKNKQPLNQQVNNKPISQQEPIIERKIVQKLTKQKILTTAKIAEPTIKDGRKESQITTSKKFIIQSELSKEMAEDEIMPESNQNLKLGLDINLQQLLPLCLSPEDTEANDITAQMLRL